MQGKPTAERIAIAARHLLDKEGADAVTMRRVAKAVGITAMAVYRHYPDREGLLNALADEGFDSLAVTLAAVRLSGDIEKRLMQILDIYIDHALQNPRLFELMFLKPRPGARRFPRDFKAGASPTANLAFQLFREGMQTGHFRKDDPWAITFETGAMLQGLVMLYLGGRMDLSPVRFRAFCRRSFRRYFHGIRN